MTADFRRQGARPVTPEDRRQLLERHGAILHGHFLLSSGRHSDVYVQTARVLERPDVTVLLAEEMSSWYGAVDVVMAPAVGAIALGFAVGLVSGARSIYAEREDGAMRLRRGFGLMPGERALVVDNVITTGASAGEVHRLAEDLGAQPLGVAALVDRSGGRTPYPLRALVDVDAASWAPDDCPLCREAVPLVSPGSRHLRQA